MTRTQPDAKWSGVPSLSHLWMAALLRLAAMFVVGAVATLQMLLSRLPRACHTDATPARLPAAEDGNLKKETQAAEEHSHSLEALMVSSEQSSRRVYPELVEGSNHEGGLTGASHMASHHNTTALLPRSGRESRARITS